MRADAGGDDGDELHTGFLQLFAFIHQANLRHQPVKGGQLQVAAKHQVAQGVEDQAALVLLNPLHHVGVVPDHQVGAGINRRAGDHGLNLIVAGFILNAKVAGIDYIIRAHALELINLIRDALVVLVEDGLPNAAKANLDAVLLVHIQRAVTGKWDARRAQRVAGAVLAVLAVVHKVVVGDVHQLNAAQF